ncbi:MAG: ABC transporter ATP-binding protein [Bacillota bacterium]
MSLTEPVLEVKNLKTCLPYHDRQVPVVNDVSFRVEPGETLGIFGESGCGKSLVALSVMGLVPPSGEVTGDVVVRGQNLAAHPELYNSLRGKSMSMIFQEPRAMVNPLLTVGRHFSEILGWHFKLPRAEALTRAGELLGEVGLNRDVLGLYPHELSGGILQRVLIALALSCEPALVIADEPATALDMTVQAQVMACFRRLQQKNSRAVILITHDLGVIHGNCDRVLVMYAGRVIEAGPVKEVFERPAHPYTGALLGIYRALAAGPSAGGLHPIPGQMPEFGEVITGCPFAPRCMLKTAGCKESCPSETIIGPGHTAACHRAGQ